MRLPSPVSISIGITLAACQPAETSSLETYGSADEVSTDSTTETDTQSEESTEESTSTETGEPEPHASLRYLVNTTEDALLLGINLDDPLAVPEPDTLISGEGVTGLFGPTPFESEIVVHDGQVDQLRLSDIGDYDFLPLAVQDALWMDRVYFGAGVDGANAILTIGQEPFGVNQQLLWVEYDSSGQVTGSQDYTPPLETNGAVLVLDRSPDGRHAAVLVDAELDSLWHIYVLNLDPQPNVATYIDVLDLTGLPPTSVGNFIWLHLDNERIVYRKEGQPGVFRPLAVELGDPDTNRINLTPALGHISSLVWSPDQTRVLVTTGGNNGYRELWLVDMLSPTMAAPPLRISEPGKDALVNTQGVIDFATLGHGFDEFGRIWYAYADSLANPVSVGINLVVVVDGEVIQRSDLTETAPGLEIEAVSFDAKLQLLGYRAQSGNLSSINYVDMTAAPAVSVRLDQDFDHSTITPVDSAGFAWSADGSHISVVGLQNATAGLYTAELGDGSGATVAVTLPDVESAAGITLDHMPRVSPTGEQVILWYAAQDGRKGLVHAPTDGSGEGQVVLGLQHSLRAGTYIQHVPE